jgi:hypothetical protein
MDGENNFWQVPYKHSAYHFNNNIKDTADGPWFKTIGNFYNHYDIELNYLHSKYITSKNPNLKPKEITPEFEHIDFINQTTRHVNKGTDAEKTLTCVNFYERPDMFPKLYELVHSFGLEFFDNPENIPGLTGKYGVKIHYQIPGNMYVMHIDEGLYNLDIDHSRLVRIHVMLEDWVPGQFIIYGNYNYQDWKAGDAHVFRWGDTPHATANASNAPRPMLQLTGLMTEKTRSILNEA